MYGEKFAPKFNKGKDEMAYILQIPGSTKPGDVINSQT